MPRAWVGDPDEQDFSKLEKAPWVPLGEKLISEAKELLGRPYKYDTKDEEVPNFFNCSLFTQYLYKKMGKEIPRSSILQATCGYEIIIQDPIIYIKRKAAIGDLIFMRGVKGHYNDALFPGRKIYIGHVVMYSGHGKYIGACGSPVGKVVEGNLLELINDPDYMIVMVRRIILA